VIDQRAIDAARNAMVDDLVARRIIRTPAVERAFRRVARHEFLPKPFALPTDPLLTEFADTDDPRRVYSDTVVALKRDKNINCGAPGVAATQIEQLAATEGMRVLHVGTGSGYYTAILAELVGERGSVVGVEYESDLVELSCALLARAGYTNVTVREGDGALGVPEAAPFDRVLVSAGAPDIAPVWIAQLDTDGRLVLPLCQLSPLGSLTSGGVILAVDKVGDALFGEFSTPAFFVPLQGALAPTGDNGALAEALQRWFALEEFLRINLPIRIAMKSALTRVPNPEGVAWYLETPNAVMWIEPE
jgi:protein-L-isoaspartate(D-aspartate) O-methyltransferase